MEKLTNENSIILTSRYIILLPALQTKQELFVEVCKNNNQDRRKTNKKLRLTYNIILYG